MSAFSKTKETPYLWTFNITRCVAMETVPSSTRSTKIHSFFPEVYSFQITSSNTCTLENCVRPPLAHLPTDITTGSEINFFISAPTGDWAKILIARWQLLVAKDEIVYF